MTYFQMGQVVFWTLLTLAFILLCIGVWAERSNRKAIEKAEKKEKWYQHHEMYSYHEVAHARFWRRWNARYKVYNEGLAALKKEEALKRGKDRCPSCPTR